MKLLCPEFPTVLTITIVLQSQLFYVFVLFGSIQALTQTVSNVVYKYNITLVIVYTYDIAASA